MVIHDINKQNNKYIGNKDPMPRTKFKSERQQVKIANK